MNKLQKSATFRDSPKKSKAKEPPTLICPEETLIFSAIVGVSACEIEIDLSFQFQMQIWIKIQHHLFFLAEKKKKPFSGLFRSLRLALSLLHRPHNARKYLLEAHWKKHKPCV